MVEKMKAMPVNDFYNTNVKIREDGRVMHQMYLWQVKAATAAKSKYESLLQNPACALNFSAFPKGIGRRPHPVRVC